MAQAGNVFSISSDSRVDFIASAAQNVPLTWRSQLPAALGGRSRFRSIVLQSAQNLDWEVFAWRNRNMYTIPAGGTIDNLVLAGKYRFFAADGVQAAGATGVYTYYIDGLDWLYQDLDTANAQLQPVANGPLNSLLPFMHIVIINRSAAGKSAGDAGALQIRCGIEATNA